MRRLDQQVAARIINAVLTFAATGQGDVTRLTGSTEWRLRVGDWRVRFTWREQPGPSGTTRAIEVLRVLPRGRAYRD